MMLRRGTGGIYVNGVVARWERAAISLRDQTTLDRIGAGDLEVKNVYLASNAVTFQPAAGTTVQGTVDLTDNAIEVGAEAAGTLFTALPLAPTLPTQVDWQPPGTSPIATGGMSVFAGAIATKAGTFVVPTAFRGAGDPAGPKWWAGWTNLAPS
jgi:hypothetical protein